MAYHQFQSPDGPYGSFEVFYQGGQLEEGGWYWWPCFPGCFPDSDEPSGPFLTEADAIADAQEGA